MAVWIALTGRSVMDKAVAIIFPISAFVAAGFEHSIANMYFIPMGLLIKTFGDAGAVADAISWMGFMNNLVPVILGNLVGGSLMVGLVYYVIYRRVKTGRAS
jgi:formate transporter